MPVILLITALAFSNYPRLPAATFDGSQLIVGGRWSDTNPTSEIGPTCLDVQDHIEPVVRFQVGGKFSFADTTAGGYNVEAMAVHEYQDSEQAIFRVFVNVLPPCRASWNRVYYLPAAPLSWGEIKQTYR